MKAWVQLLVAGVSVLLAFLAGAVIIGARGHNPIEVYRVLFTETLGDPMGLGQVIFKATTLLFTGVAAAFAFRAGMFNIGGEGQLYLGAFACALAGVLLPASTPAFVAIPILVVAAFAGGALGAAPPAILKATRGTHEVINTMMMNFIIGAVVSYVVGRIGVRGTVHMKPILEAGLLPKLIHGADASVAVAAGVLACLVVHWFLARTRAGYEFRAVGLSPKAAEYGGVAVPRVMMTSLLASGGIAGLGGINFVMVSPGYFERDFAPGQGYLGIAVALLARNNPIAVIPAAFLFAVLSEGGQSIQPYVPKQIGEILQAVIILCVVVGAKLAEGMLSRIAKKRAAAHV